MTESSQFYRDRAEQAARDAAETPLVNVKERWLRSEAAWRSIAERLERSEAARKQAVAERTERAAAEG